MPVSRLGAVAGAEGRRHRGDRGQVRRGLAGVGTSQDRRDDARRRAPGVHLDRATSAPPARPAAADRVRADRKYEHLYRADIGDGDALAVEVHRFRLLYNTIRPHQVLADRTPAQVYTAPGGGPGLVSA
jgi:hypothetical protein